MEEQNTNNTCCITIKNQITEFTEVVKTIDQVCYNWNVSPKIVNQLNLAIEEAVSNIIFYAFSDKREHIISIILSNNKDNITVQISDDGKSFNILEVDNDIDINASVEEREIGGLGIYILKKMVDVVEYQRKGNMNILKLTKKLENKQ